MCEASAILLLRNADRIRSCSGAARPATLRAPAVSEARCTNKPNLACPSGLWRTKCAKRTQLPEAGHRGGVRRAGKAIAKAEGLDAATPHTGQARKTNPICTIPDGTATATWNVRNEANLPVLGRGPGAVRGTHPTNEGPIVRNKANFRAEGAFPTIPVFHYSSIPSFPSTWTRGADCATNGGLDGLRSFAEAGQRREPCQKPM